jgi:hypothetical protein
MTVFPLFSFVLAEVAIRVPRAARLVLGALALYSVLVTVALVRAAQGGEVTLAVDPFEMSSLVFRATAPLFPDYRSWTSETVVRTVGWVSAGLGLGALLAWREFEPVRSAVRGMQRRARGQWTTSRGAVLDGAEGGPQGGN